MGEDRGWGEVGGGWRLGEGGGGWGEDGAGVVWGCCGVGVMYVGVIAGTYESF